MEQWKKLNDSMYSTIINLENFPTLQPSNPPTLQPSLTLT